MISPNQFEKLKAFNNVIFIIGRHKLSHIIISESFIYFKTLTTLNFK